MPLSFIGILEKCSLWAGEETLSADQKRQIIDEIPRLYSVVDSCGRVPDLKMEELWSFLPPVECATHTLEDLAVNRDRVARGHARHATRVSFSIHETVGSFLAVLPHPLMTQ